MQLRHCPGHRHDRGSGPIQLSNSFRVAAIPADAWKVLTDIPRIAPCLPGAELKSVEGDEYKGVVKVKVGPITAQYAGVARFTEQDEAAGRAVLSAEGRDTRGAGNARATITATLTPDGDGTRVSVVTDLDVTGRVAQFGRGVLADVSAKLMEQFADCLSKQLATPSPEPASGKAAGVGGAPRSVAAGLGGPTARENGDGTSPNPPTEAIGAANAAVDLGKLAGGAVLRRLAPLAGAGVVAFWLLWRNRRRRARR
ncbi:MAG TPA: SRPBCC family protein [Acidimicrobiales bacterium]|nr:SRPBCC family protein [Acidimicrobiales bacterium]